GDNLEAKLGSVKTLVLYLAAGLAGSAAVLVTDSHGVGTYAGASGAIAGFLGAYAVMFPKSRIYVMPRWFIRMVPLPAIVFFLAWFAAQLAGIYAGSKGVAFWAHVGGFVVGAGAGFIARDRD